LLIAAVLSATACDDNDEPSAAADGGGRGDAGYAEAGTGKPLPEYALLDDLCDLPHQAQRVAITETGFAHLSCASGSPALTAWPEGESKPVTIAEVSAETTFEFTLDGEFLLYRDGTTLRLRGVDAAKPALEINGVEDYRLFMERVSNTKFSPRLITLEAGDAELRSVHVRKADDGYTKVTSLLDDKLIRGDLSLISASGRTALVTVEGANRKSFIMLRTNAAEAPFEMPFGPGDLRMAPVGLGDTHNFAFDGDRVVRVELQTGSKVELVPAGAGLLPGISHLIEREDAPGVKYLHYIVNGDPSRRIREATAPEEALAKANATAQMMTPDTARIVYLSDGDVFSVSAVGGKAPLRLLANSGLTDQLAAFFAPDSASMAVLDARSGLWLVPLDRADDALALDADVRAGSVGYTPGGHLLWLTQAGVLKALAPAATEPVELASGVDAWWPPKAGEELLYASGSLLFRRSPE
jgi:endonuclease YncB( thermonuclease family)